MGKAKKAKAGSAELRTFEGEMSRAGDRTYEQLPPASLTELQREVLAVFYEFSTRVETEIAGWPVAGDYPVITEWRTALAKFREQFPRSAKTFPAGER